MSPYQFNIRHLKILTEINENNSLRFIADKCGISQSALSQAINKIEENIDSKILLRTTRGSVLTQSGTILQHRAKRFFDYQDQAQELLWEYQKKQKVKKNLLAKCLHRVNMIEIKAFICLYKNNNYATAAREMQITESSMYRTLKGLELKVEAILFVKADKIIKATAIAKKLFKFFKLAINELQSALDDIYFYAQKEQNIQNINLGTLSLPKYSLIPKVLAEFTQRYSLARISIIDGSYNSLLATLLEGEIDFFVGALRDDDNPNITQLPLFSEGLYIVANPTHPLANSEVSAEQLKHCSWIVPLKGAPTYKKLTELYALHNLPSPQIKIQCASVSIILNLVKDGEWLTLLSLNQFKHFEDMGLVTKIGRILPSSKRKIGVTFRSDWQPSIRQEAFINLLKKFGSLEGEHHDN